MLDVAYKTVDDLTPGRAARIDEDRGTIRVCLDEHAPLADVVRQLNVEIDQLMASVRWFQLWNDEIVSRATPGSPLQIEYVFMKELPSGVGIAEKKGLVRVYINPILTTAQFAAAMNPATDEQLAAGRWFQMFAGEIIDNGPEPLSKV
ncbi:hypothetical protein [Streptomyces sp. NPDC050704]|uniref:hypothetical protein n=1 Tax=Streptomyces sp. NPDC050704 TaxID=3157219 RepID=UPI003431F510